ncbi:MAG: hypothetical protein U9R74_10500 [Pseudomonadota bacterium]|nr:hypothetical protein [Pseudomonadota bacterium]
MSSTRLFHQFIQVAGVIDDAEAQLLRDCGVGYLGFPLRLPVNREDLTEAAAAGIIRSLAPPAYGIAITYQDDANDIAAFTGDLGVGIVQLHGDISQGELARLKRQRPALKVIKSLAVGPAGVDTHTGVEDATGRKDAGKVRRFVSQARAAFALSGNYAPDSS